ncbi:MAG: hypothetical protein NZ847_09450 [Acidobacteria bacterium]|nr:hypothetical protein [Acidobacteriota bacterium]
MDLTLFDITRIPKGSVEALVSLPNLIEDPDVETIFGEEMVQETGSTTGKAFSYLAGCAPWRFTGQKS